jgi:hypothetical protein
MVKQTITIQEILGKYYYKSWIKEELGNIGESTSGTKDELIDRFLQSDATTSKSVTEVAQNLISPLRNTDLKQILHDHNLNHVGNREELLSRVLGSFNFEPYVNLIERPCEICSSDTEQEVHFNDKWKASNFKCTVCHHEQLIGKEQKNNDKNAVVSRSNTSDVLSYLRHHYWQVISLFIAVTIGLDIRYGWVIGTFISIVITAIVAYFQFFLIEHRIGKK